MERKIALTIIISIIIFISAFGQQSITKQNIASPNPKSGKVYSLPNGKEDILYGWFDKTLWELYSNNAPQSPPVKAENVPIDIEKYLSVDKFQIYDDYDLVKKYKTNIDATFQHLKLLGSDQQGMFFYSNDLHLPIHFFNYGTDTALTFVISGVYIDNIYNTLKLTSRQRATKVVTTYLLPALKRMINNFQNSDVKYFGMSAVYGSKDASDESALATKAEYVAIVVPSSLLANYAAGDITEDELIDSSDIYNSDRDMNSSVKKIKLKLE